MTRFLEILRQVRPLQPAHRQHLPQDILELSRRLTDQRSELVHPYFSNPRLISAYLYYFLPWNLLRLTRFLAAQTLPSPKEGKTVLLDLGSGPATVPLALFLAKPEWRRLPLQIVCQDRSPQILRLGKALLAQAAQRWEVPAWKVTLLSCPMEQVAQQFLTKVGREGLFLVTQANVLNELLNRKSRRQGRSQIFLTEASDWEEEEQASLFEQRLEEFLEEMARIGGTGPLPLLCLEPGTRLGGKIIMHLREKARELGLGVDAPCPHRQGCPLLRGAGRRTWCHYTFSTDSVPPWLEELSAEAHLRKEALSLAPLLLRLGAPQTEAADDSARVLSAPFPVPGLAGRASYACSAHGLLLLENAENLACGDSVTLPHNLGQRRDQKSGALIVPCPSSPRTCSQKNKAWPTRKGKKA
ncbi:MAG: small ribosomal subunit Rsm22 family protein [Desulfovibrio sp.]|nr:small ribosomal subunit Rsm22 family protein [Desulfovibrio sp.]